MTLHIDKVDQYYVKLLLHSFPDKLKWKYLLLRTKAYCSATLHFPIMKILLWLQIYQVKIQHSYKLNENCSLEFLPMHLLKWFVYLVDGDGPQAG